MRTKTWWAAGAALIWLGARIWAQAPNGDEAFLDETAEKGNEPVHVSLMLRAGHLSHAHDALQHRADYTDWTRQHWQQGESSGDGWGATLAVKQGPHELTLRRERLSHEFNMQEHRDMRHHVATTRDDWEILYWHRKEGGDEIGDLGAWGWHIGVRHIASRKSLEIVERSARLEQNGEVTWKLLQGGYWGVYRPAKWHARLFGAIHFFFGEVEGLARHGNDEKLDGRIREQWRNDQGLAYGLGGTLGAGFDFLKYASVNLGYRREWLYSFQATDSGVVVFPDNDDALFIENISGLYAEIGARFRF